jgi:uncharacterized protein
VFDLGSVTLATGEQRRERIPVAIAPMTIGGEPFVPVPPAADAEFAVTRLRNGWVFDLAFSTEIHGTCHRCLEAAVLPLDIDTSEFHAFRPDPGAEADMTCEFLHDDLDLDLEAMASAAVVLAMPVRVLCRDDCRGLCPNCGTNLNEGPCRCPPDEPDARWAKLGDLL